jgi:formiminoglutamase
VYIPADPENWQGRVDEEDGAAGHRWHQRVKFDAPATKGVSLLGLASDMGVKLNKGRPGASEGPAALRRALAGQAWHHPLQLHDDGDIRVLDALDTGQQAYADRLQALLQGGQFVIGLGGGHEIGWASYLGCRQWMDVNLPGKTLGILNFDAHFDLRKPAPHTSSGTPFYQVAQHCAEQGHKFHYGCMGIARPSNTGALFNQAQELSVNFLLDRDCQSEKSTVFVRDFLANVDCLYLTFCLDVFPAALAPGVSAPAALGVNPQWVMETIAAIGNLCVEYDVNWLMADVAELSPAHDSSNATARLAARLVDEMLSSKF